MNLLNEEKQIIQAGRYSLIDFSIILDKNYKPSFHHEKIANALERVEKGEIKRLIIQMPPRHGKSQLASINFPAWYLGRNPDKEIITASYSADLAIDFGSKTRDVVSDELYKEIFETRLKQDDQNKAKWKTNKKGSYTSVGVGGPLTGRGANVLIIDDPIKNREEAESETIRKKVWDWYTSTAYTRLEKNGAIIVIMTRWHLDDLAGRLLDYEEHGGEHWEVISFPAVAEQDEDYRKEGEALWPAKYDLDALMNIKQNIGAYDWNCTPAYTPILMADWTYKPISEVKEGDCVVGFQKGNSKERAKLVKTRVLRTFKKVDDIYKISVESGRNVECTLSHRWYTGRGEGDEAKGNYLGRKQYDVPKIGRRLMYVGNEEETVVNSDLINELNYFAGIVDGEGHIGDNTLVIGQTVGKNDGVCNRMIKSMDLLGIDYNKKLEKRGEKHKNWKDFLNFQIRNSSLIYRKLLRYTDIGKRQQIIDRMYKRSHMPIREKDKIIGINFLKNDNVYALETETHNYIAWGYISSNSLYQQNPIHSDTQEFKREWFKYFTDEDILLLDLDVYALVDLAISEGKEADNTSIQVIGKNRNKPEIYKLEDLTGRLDPAQMIEYLFHLKEKYKFKFRKAGIESVGYQKSLMYFINEEQRRRQTYFDVVELKAVSSKESRIRGLVPMYKNGIIYHRNTDTDYENELLTFPFGKHDDRIDAMAYLQQVLENTKTSQSVKQYTPDWSKLKR